MQALKEAQEIMERTFNRIDLESRLSRLESRRQLAFGASCSERMLPNYSAFQNDAGWGHPDPLRKALDVVWSALGGTTHSPDSITRLIASCENVTPSSDHFTSLYVSLAQDACFSCCELLEFLLANDVVRISEVATYATDSVDLFVQEIESMVPADPDLESKILNHPLMQRELRRQRLDLEDITSRAFLDPEFLTQLRRSSQDDGSCKLDNP